MAEDHNYRYATY